MTLTRSLRFTSFSLSSSLGEGNAASFQKSLEIPDDFVGGLYDVDSPGDLSTHRDLESFCLDASPLPPKIDNLNKASLASVGKTPGYHILRENSTNYQLDKVAERIKMKYRQLLQTTFKNSKNKSIASDQRCHPTIMEYRCSGSASSRCGGMGDRLRGVAATFFMALLTNSVFSIKWDYPTDLENYFEPAFLPHHQVAEQYYPENPHELVVRVIDDEEDIVWLLSDITRMRHMFRQYDKVVMEINSLVPLEVLLSHPYYRSLVDFYDITNFSYSELFSIAMRVFLPQYSPQLKTAVEPYLKTLSNSRYDGTFGVQIRLGSTSWNEAGRVGSSQVGCFMEQVANISYENNYKQVVVFATADSQMALDQLQAMAKKQQGLSIDLITAADTAEITHIDRTNFKGDNQEQQVLRTFVDWSVLASPLIKHLVISRSSFGETASLLRMSAKPVRRLSHNVTDSCIFHDFEMTSVWMESSAVSKIDNTFKLKLKLIFMSIFITNTLSRLL